MKNQENIYVNYSIIVKQTDKIFQEYMLIYEMDVYRKNQSSILIRLKENFNIYTVLPYVTWPTDRRANYLQNRYSYLRGIGTKNYTFILISD